MLEANGSSSDSNRTCRRYALKKNWTKLVLDKDNSKKVSDQTCTANGPVASSAVGKATVISAPMSLFSKMEQRITPGTIPLTFCKEVLATEL